MFVKEMWASIKSVLLGYMKVTREEITQTVQSGRFWGVGWGRRSAIQHAARWFSCESPGALVFSARSG